MQQSTVVDDLEDVRLNTLMTKPVSSRFQRSVFWAKSHKLLALFLFIVLLVVGIFVYERVALELNKRAFARARTAIDTVYADIVAQVGQPDNSKRSSFCSRPNQTFGQGPLSCNVDTSFIYGVANEDQANVYLKKIQIVINNHKNFKLSKLLSPAITSLPVVNSIYSSATDYYKTAGMECIVSYWYDTPRQINLVIKDQSKKSIEISLGCDDLARAMYYPKN